MNVLYQHEIADPPNAITSAIAITLLEEIRNFIAQRFSVLNDEMLPFENDGAAVIIIIDENEGFNMYFAEYGDKLTEKLISCWSENDNTFLNLKLAEIHKAFGK